MRPVSERFLRALRGSHGMSARARVVEPGQIGVDPDGTELAILAGEVRLDARADVRGILTLTVDGTGMWPNRRNLALAPYGNEIHVSRGVQYGGGSIEWCSLGYYRIDTVTQDDPPDGPIVITALDRMAAIVDARLTSPKQLSASLTYGQAVNELVLEVLPWATVEWDDTTNTRALGRDVLVEEDRYKALRDLVESVGKIAYWDHRGILVVKTPPDPAVPVWDVTHGKDGVLVSMRRELTRDGVYNAVVARGEGADTETPVQAVVVDSDPRSPTRWGGPFGQVPRFYFSPLITDPSQAETAARTLLAQSLGLPYSVDFGAVVNPALEPWDPIRVTYPGGVERHIVDTLVIPLVADAPMTGTTREQAVTILGAA